MEVNFIPFFVILYCMIKTEKIVSFELASKLKKIGYNQPCESVYFRNKRNKIGWALTPSPIQEHDCNSVETRENQTSAPYYYDVNDWLLNTLGIKVIFHPSVYINNGEEMIRYNEQGTDLLYEYSIGITPQAFRINHNLAEFLMHCLYHEPDTLPMKPDTERGAFEQACTKICHIIIAYSNTMKMLKEIKGLK